MNNLPRYSLRVVVVWDGPITAQLVVERDHWGEWVKFADVEALLADTERREHPHVTDGKCPTCGAFGIPESRLDKASSPRSAEEQRVWDVLDEARQHVKPRSEERRVGNGWR